MVVKSLLVKIGADSTELQTNLKKSEGRLSEFKNRIGEMAAAVTAGMLAFTAINGVVKKFAGMLGDCVKAAAESEAAENSLQLALSTTGREVIGNARHFSDYASQLMKVTKYDDEVIKGAQTLLIQLTNLDQKGLDAATRGSIGLATVMGIDLRNAAMLVAKAMEGNFAALSRYGIKVSENLPLAEKQAQLLAQLQEMYKRAEGEVGTFSGRITQLKNYYQELKERIGFTIINCQGFRDILAAITQVLKEFADPGAKASATFQFIGKMAEIAADKLKAKFGLALAMLMVDLQKSIDMTNKAGVSTETFVKGWELLGKISPGLQSALKAGYEELSRLNAAAYAGGEAVKTLSLNLGQAMTSTRGMAGATAEVKAAVTANILPAANDMQTAFFVATKNIDTTFGDMAYSLKLRFQDLVLAWQEQMNKILGWAAYFVGGLDALFSQAAENQRIRLENEEKMKTEALTREYTAKSAALTSENAQAIAAINAEYAAKAKAIKDTITDEKKKKVLLELLEQQKNAALEKLKVAHDAATEKLETQRTDAEAKLAEDLEKKKSEARKKEARAAKAVALLSAIVNTASAIVEALPNIPLAIAVGIMGAAQIALIASQPLPLGEGGLVKKPTYAMIGERGPELVLPLKDLNPAFAMAGGGMVLRQTNYFYGNISNAGDLDEISKRLAERTSQAISKGRRY